MWEVSSLQQLISEQPHYNHITFMNNKSAIELYRWISEISQTYA